MSKPTKVVVDCSTGISTEIELTDEEIAEVEAREQRTLAEIAEREAEAQAKAEARASALAKLTALGLSEEEAKAVLGR